MNDISAFGKTGSRHALLRLAAAAALTAFVALGAPASFAADAAAPVATGTQAAVSLPRVAILATGGTIAGKADARAANAYNAGAVSAQQLVDAVPGIEKLARLSPEQVASIGSQDMNDGVWFKLAKRIQEISDRNEADAIVITHGTDTLEETAFFLDNVLHTNKPVVLVGSMRPSTAISADGPANLYEAVEVAADPHARGRGVMIVLNDTIHSARGATKTNSTSVQTFVSPNSGPIGYVDPASVRFLAPATADSRKKYALPADGKLPPVEIVYSHSNMDAQQIDHAIADHVKGIVLAGVGDGNTSGKALDALQQAARQGILVVRSTRVGSGFVNRNVEVNDDQRGFAVSLDLNPQKARILTQLLISNGITSPADVQRAFSATW
ncbi:asparaginase [Burkholderia plantarii]|uniref:L-asparaginase, type II n=1 Tax=Burkholderia plantarii TaxID=41899 RepID=A0A0B6S482_BURPL|nr:asparaginase [Burkholderia plantarii]AJK50478.1 L-asparaginase, type II [Burkholderia plantarii]ALK34658.1 type II L-asparaginase [Burkholderia plantarii]GLZ22349.1 L-asparaginase [Burkholderia plantarii]